MKMIIAEVIIVIAHNVPVKGKREETTYYTDVTDLKRGRGHGARLHINSQVTHVHYFH